MRGSNPFFKSYDLFFQVLRAGKYQDFTSALEEWLAKVYCSPDCPISGSRVWRWSLFANAGNEGGIIELTSFV